MKSEQKCSRRGGKNPEPLLYLVHLLRPEQEAFEKRKRQLRRIQQHREARRPLPKRTEKAKCRAAQPAWVRVDAQDVYSNR